LDRDGGVGAGAAGSGSPNVPCLGASPDRSGAKKSMLLTVGCLDPAMPTLKRADMSLAAITCPSYYLPVRVNEPAASPAELSVTATARRAQIVAATAEVIAEVGYSQASYARIAAHAGLSSTRLISYHFAGKDELIAAVADDVMSAIGAFMHERVGAESTAAGMLRAYIEGTIEFIAANQARMTALMEIVLNGALHWDGETDREVVGPLEGILRKGQADGEFRDFDPRVVATTVQRSIDGLPLLLAADPDLDLAAYARELVTLFELGTQAGERS
jgi:AcrR family transcriptional regulator